MCIRDSMDTVWDLLLPKDKYEILLHITIMEKFSLIMELSEQMELRSDRRAWIYIQPVSYTHLDVYKRQDL